MARTKRAPQAAGQTLIVKPKTPMQKLMDGTIIELMKFNPPDQDRVRAATAKLLHARTLPENEIEAVTEAAVVELRKLSNEVPDGSKVERLLAKRALARWYSVAGQEMHGLALERYRDCRQLIWQVQTVVIGPELAAYIQHLQVVLPNERDECLVPAWPVRI